jgi:hypothetical protein
MPEPKLVDHLANIAIVTGGRDYDLTDEDKEWLGRMWERFGFRIVLHGDCPTGVDRQAAAWARSLGLCDAACPAQWEDWRRKHGRPELAGPDRNSRMATACRFPVAAVCLAFPGGRGTADMKRQAKLHNIDVLEAPSVGALRKEQTHGRAAS